MVDINSSEHDRRERKRLRGLARAAHPFGLEMDHDPTQLVYDDEASEDAAVVAIAGRDGRFGGSSAFEVFAALGDMASRRIFVRDVVNVRDHPWGQDLHQVARTVSELLAAHHRRVFIGTSLGGYLALILGTLSNADRVIVVNPTTFVDSAVRWPDLDEHVTNDMLLDVLDLWAARPAPVVDLHFSYRNDAHRMHAEHVAGHPAVTLHAHYEYLPMVKVRDDGTLRRQVLAGLA